MPPSSMAPQLGLWQQFPTPMVSRFVARMGWDFVVLDLQHGAMSTETVYECIHTLRSSGCEAWVRTGIGNSSEISRMLDLGAQGVVVPMVNRPEEAEEAAAAARYPPRGRRSFGGDARHLEGDRSLQAVNESVRLLVQIEHQNAVRAAAEILSVTGVDGCFSGPIDLALSMGLSKEDVAESPQLREAIEETLKACRRLGKLAACNTYSLAEAGRRARQGYGFITLQSDVDLFVASTAGLLQDLRREVDPDGYSDGA